MTCFGRPSQRSENALDTNGRQRGSIYSQYSRETTVKDPVRPSVWPFMGKRWIISVLCSLLCFLGAALAQNGEFQQGRTKIKAPVAEKESAVIQQTISRPAEPKVPDLTNHNLTDAKTLLGNVFVLGEPRYVPSKKLAGLIVRQFPEAGSPAKSGTEVEVWVSTPVKPETNAPTPVLVPVPGLIGHKRDVAIGMLALVGLQAGALTTTHS